MRGSLLLGFFLMVICPVCFSFSLFVAASQCLSNEQTLLLQLKNNLKFDSNFSTKLVTWNQSVDCCSWRGITCRDEHVIGLNLANESISGGLDNSSSLFGLLHLQSLNLAFNDFNFNGIPSELGKLANLRYLKLSDAKFKGQVPLEISYLTRLVVLDLSFNYHLELKNPNLSMLIRNFSELTKLYLDKVSISIDDNEWCRALSSSLPNLRELSLSYCNLSSPIDSSLQKLQFLSIIHLSGNNFFTAIPKSFGDFNNLTILDLSSSKLNGTFPEKIFQVSTLQVLDLSLNGLLHGSLPEFHSNSSLRTISLSNTGFSGTLPKSIGNLKLLSLINLQGCNFIGSIPESIETLTKVVYLDMSNNKFNGSIPIFDMSKNLIKLDLSYNFLTGQINSTWGQKLLNLKYLNLSSNSLEGNVPISLFSLQLEKLNLSNNRFLGQLNKPFNIFGQLNSLDLSNNSLEGSIPMSFFEVQHLEWLSLSSNNFSGSLQLQIGNLFYLNLSHNHLLKVESSVSNLSSLSFSPIDSISLAYNHLEKIPDFLRNITSLSFLDLSNNHIDGEMPNWICNLTDLEHLDLSYNFLDTLEGLFFGPDLNILNLHSNNLQGQLLAKITSPQLISLSSPMSSKYCDCTWIKRRPTPRAIYLSDNMFDGRTPKSICNISILRVLDLSNNSFSDTIPLCLLELSNSLGVLNLRENDLKGTISNVFPNKCALQALILNGNELEGKIPKSLANCKELEVLDIGNNNIKGTFPFYLEKVLTLKVLILRSNNFYGPIPHLGRNTSWLLLQIVDVALNKFSGGFPKFNFSTWKAMVHKDLVKSGLHYLQYDSPKSSPYSRTMSSNFHYRLAVTITSKGSSRMLANILTAHTTIDFSCNNFDGSIPKEIGELKMLFALNLSHNAFKGQIPSSLEKLSNLESLDLSSNNLFGKIPMQLADGLISLSALNLSFNQLEGQIPSIKQFATFENSSFEGNKNLCGFPLSLKCIDEKPPMSPPTSDEIHLNSKTMIQWNYISIELGFIFGLGIVIGPLMFWKKWKVKYYQSVDNIFLRIFPHLSMGRSYHQRRHNK